MSAFEFFFSFYGLLLGLSVAVIATGLATAIQHRKKIRIGWLTPMLALFVGLDIASFWDSAWTNFRHLPFSYGMLIAGLAIALVYFIAASLVFPHDLDDGQSLDDHFWANKAVVLILTAVANTLMIATTVVANLGKPEVAFMLTGYGFTLLLYLAIILPAAAAKRSRLFAILIGLQILLFAASAVISAISPNSLSFAAPNHAGVSAP